MRQTHCKSCGAEIVWAKTAAGKAAPYEVDPEGYWATEDGKARQVTLGQQSDGTTRYTSHFATCPQAPAWRKPS